MPLRDQLLMLQHSDSFFPSGASSWSWGLETLAADFQEQFKQRNRRHLQQIEKRSNNCQMIDGFVVSQIKQRWYVFDAIFIAESWQCTDDVEQLLQLDDSLHQHTLVNEARQGSLKLGQTLLKIYAELPIASQFFNHIQAGRGYGHQAVVQGAIFKALGMSLESTLLSSGHGLITNMVSAGIRLGLIGYLEGQQVIQHSHQVLADLIEQQLPTSQHLSTFNPMAEIAMMRHEHQQSRLFSN